MSYYLKRPLGGGIFYHLVNTDAVGSLDRAGARRKMNIAAINNVASYIGLDLLFFPSTPITSYSKYL